MCSNEEHGGTRRLEATQSEATSPFSRPPKRAARRTSCVLQPATAGFVAIVCRQTQWSEDAEVFRLSRSRQNKCRPFPDENTLWL